jgi:hypothetical protein|tara:strand:+ start:132 stop:611 length:480 start_codon:yes stop_codon:yes gene_type:complete
MKFIRAHFGNNERTEVKAYYADDEGNQIPYVISAEDGNPQWKKLLKHITIDELHESTHEYIRQSQEDYESEVMAIAKKRGMLLEFDEKNSDSYKKLLDIIFIEDENEQTAKESLFAFKLALFEFDAIKNSTDREAKAKIRKAVNTIDALESAIQIIKQN